MVEENFERALPSKNIKKYKFHLLCTYKKEKKFHRKSNQKKKEKIKLLN